MDKQLQDFFASAKSITLSSAERQKAKNALQKAVSRLTFDRHTERMADMAAASVSLSSAEKSAAFARISNFMEMHPVRSRPGVSWRLLNVLRQPFALRALPATAVIVGVIAMSGSGLAYAAEDALPGDPLYAVKVGMTEPVREALAGSVEQQARVRLWRLERRLQEMEFLLQNDRLTDQQRSALGGHIERHTAHMNEYIAVMAEQTTDSAEELQDEYYVALDLHETAVTALADRHERRRKMADPILLHLQQAKGRLVPRHVEGRPLPPPAKLRQDVERMSEQMHKTSELIRKQYSEDAPGLQQRMQEVQQRVDAARMQMELGNERQTRELLRDSDRTVRSVRKQTELLPKLGVPPPRSRPNTGQPQPALPAKNAPGQQLREALEPPRRGRPDQLPVTISSSSVGSTASSQQSSGVVDEVVDDTLDDLLP